jgi:hypothetical protein
LRWLDNKYALLVEFEKAFYRNLACGKQLQQAFDIACHEILVCPRILPQHRHEEVKKFCLLPTDANHNVPIFFQRQQKMSSPRRKQQSISFPPSPHAYVGRELEQNRVLQALRQSRLVRVSGLKGVGKSALIKACCHYLNDRLHILDFHEIIWVPYQENDQKVTPFDHIKEVFQLIQAEECVSFLARARDSISKIVEYLHFRKTLLVIDAKDIKLDHGITNLSMFVEELIKVRRSSSSSKIPSVPLLNFIV